MVATTCCLLLIPSHILGLIGASVLQLISKDKKYDITVLVRAEEKAKKVREITGVKTIIGSLEDAALLTSTAAKFEVVIQIVCLFLF